MIYVTLIILILNLNASVNLKFQKKKMKIPPYKQESKPVAIQNILI